MLWNYCVVLCIYEHGHDNVVRRLCGNIDHGIVGEPVDTTHTIYAGAILYPSRGAPAEIVRESRFPRERLLCTPAVFTLPSVLEIVFSS